MTRQEATAELKRLAHGLGCDEAGVGRVLERVSVEGDASMLRDVLVELGAVALLREARP